MRYIVTLFWAVILGQVVGYIGGALSSSPYDFTMTTIISLVAEIDRHFDQRCCNT